MKPINQLHITVGSAPTGQLSLEHDLRMTKAALIYADKVRLCSLTSNMILQVLALTAFTPRQQLQFMKEIIPVLSTDQSKSANTISGINQFLSLTRKGRHLNRQELLFKIQFEKQMSKEWEKVQSTIFDLAITAGAEGLVEVLETGLLELPVFTPKKNEDHAEAMITQYLDVIGKAVSDGSTYPLLDDQTCGLISAGIKEGRLKVTSSGISRGKHTGLVANFFERLPLFDRASIQDIVEIRSELGSSLIRFRSTVAKYASQIQSAQWSLDFLPEADELFTKEVAPAILELEEAYKASSFLRSLAKKIGEPMEIPKTSFIGLVVSALAEFGHLTEKTLLIGTAAGAANLAHDAYREWKAQQKNIERSQLYFYYRTGQRLEELCA